MMHSKILVILYFNLYIEQREKDKLRLLTPFHVDESQHMFYMIKKLKFLEIMNIAGGDMIFKELKFVQKESWACDVLLRGNNCMMLIQNKGIENVHQIFMKLSIFEWKLGDDIKMYSMEI